MLLRPSSRYVWIHDDHAHQLGLQAVAVDVVLRHKLALHVQVLDLLRGDILALRKLEEVLLPVDDLQAAVWRPQPDVARVEPAVLVDGLGGLVWHLVVACKDVGPAEADLAPPMARDGTIAFPVDLVRAQVAHVRDFLEPDLVDANRPTDGSGDAVIRVRERAHGHGLGEAVALLHGTAKDDSQEVKHVVGDGGAAGDEEADPVEAYLLLDLREEQPVPQRVGHGAPRQPRLLGGVAPVEERELDAARLLDARAQLVVDAVEQPRH
mmetsp:Transcript_111454/g.296166  ORF Transcript_111454/g.296166 Transcript_111454/m.296166 type:complete len:266 (-) Transcript_111454:1015-1812(-)